MQPPSDRQLELFDIQHFGDADSMAADAPDDLRTLARKLPSQLYLGTSSWSFPGWSGLVYNRRYAEAILAKEGLGAYARHPLLRTVCVDRTYYASIPAEEFAAYARQVPRHFRFVVKAPQACVAPQLARTPSEAPVENPKFLDPHYAAEEIAGPMLDGLGEKAALLLFQFPPETVRDARGRSGFLKRLERFLGRLPEGLRYAVEVRSRPLIGPDYFRVLDAASAVHCFNVHPAGLALDRQLELAGGEQPGPLLVRWMLHPGLGYEEARERYAPFNRLVDPQPATRAKIVQLCRLACEQGQPAYVIVNNKAEGSAPLSVVEVAREWGQASG